MPFWWLGLGLAFEWAILDSQLVFGGLTRSEWQEADPDFADEVVEPSYRVIKRTYPDGIDDEDLGDETETDNGTLQVIKTHKMNELKKINQRYAQRHPELAEQGREETEEDDEPMQMGGSEGIDVY